MRYTVCPKKSYPVHGEISLGGHLQGPALAPNFGTFVSLFDPPLVIYLDTLHMHIYLTQSFYNSIWTHDRGRLMDDRGSRQM